MYKKYKTYIWGILLILVIFLAFRCTDKRSNNNEDIDNNIKQTMKKDIENKGEKIQTQDLIIFVPNETNTLLEERRITLNTDGQSTLDLIIKALKENNRDNSGYIKPIPSNMIINKIEKNNDKVVVDFKNKNIQKDPVKESIILDSLVLSLTTIEGIEKVQIKLDGKDTERFMGSFDVSQPLTIENVTNNVKYINEKNKKDKKGEVEKDTEEELEELNDEKILKEKENNITEEKSMKEENNKEIDNAEQKPVENVEKNADEDEEKQNSYNAPQMSIGNN